MRWVLIAAALAASPAMAQTTCSFNGAACTDAPTDGGAPVSAAQAAAVAPVASVNAQIGAVTVPSSVRASCTISSFDGTGAGSCTLANFSSGSAFTTTPDCVPAVTSAVTGYVYATPTVTNSKTVPAVNSQAAQKVLNISLGLTTVWGPAPAGTVVTMVCRGS